MDDRDPYLLGCVAHACEADRETLGPDLAVVGGLHPPADFHQRRPAGAALAHQYVDFAATVEIDGFERPPKRMLEPLSRRRIRAR
jgi:hypothetical protein